MWSRLPGTASFVQAAVGLLLCTLPVVIRPINFPIACLIGVWYILTRFLFIAEPSFGTHVRFAVFPLFSQTAGMLWGACMSSLCKLIGGTNIHDNTSLAVHCVILPIGLIPLCMVRATAKPPMLWVDGLFMVVVYGAACLLVFNTPSASLFWSQTISYLLLTFALSAAATALCGLMVPVLATRQLARAVAACISGTADALNKPGMLSSGPQAATSLANPTVNAMPEPNKPGKGKFQSSKSSNNIGTDSKTLVSRGGGIPVGSETETDAASSHDSEAMGDGELIPPQYMKAFDPPVRLAPQEWAAVRRLQAHAKGKDEDADNRLKHAPTSQFRDLEAPSPNIINGELLQHEYLQLLQHVTSPPRVNSLPFIPIKPWSPRIDLRPEWATVYLRPQVAAARKLLGSASLEPPPFLAAASVFDRIQFWFIRHFSTSSKQLRQSSSKDVLPMQEPAKQHAQHMHTSGAVFNSQAWGGLLNQLSSLLDHLAALEAVASDVRVALALVLSPYGTAPEQCHATALYRAAQSALKDAGRELQQHAAALRAWSGRPGPTPAGPEQTLASHIESVSDAALLHIQAYWAGVVVHTTQGRPIRVHHTEQWRAFHFCAIATLQLLRQLQELSPKVAAALGHPHGASTQQPGSPPNCNPSGTSQLPAQTAAPSLISHSLAWVKPLLPVAYGRDVWTFYWESLNTLYNAARQGRSGWLAVLEDRQLQWGLKYWLAQAAVLVALFVALSKAPKNLFFSPFVTIFMYIASAATMSEKVETTVSKTFIRIIGTGLGCLVGWGLMYHQASAQNPYAVVTVVVGVGAFLGLLGATNFKYSAMLAYATLWSVALCQYCGQHCSHAGSTTYMLDRLVLVSIGCVLPVLISQLVLPWYLSSWALDQLARSYQSAAQLLVANHQQFRSQMMCDSNQDEGKHLLQTDSGNSTDNNEPDGTLGHSNTVGSITSPGAVSRRSPGSLFYGKVNSSGFVQLSVRASDGIHAAAVAPRTAIMQHASPASAQQHTVVTITDSTHITPPITAPTLTHKSQVTITLNADAGHQDTQPPRMPRSDGQHLPVSGSDRQQLHVSGSDVDLDVEAGTRHPQNSDPSAGQPSSGQLQGNKGERHEEEQQANEQDQQTQAIKGAKQQGDKGPQDDGFKPPAAEDNGSSKLSPPLPVKPVKLADMLGPLALVTDVMARDAPLWTRGVLSMPPIVHELMAVLTLLGDRLAAFQVALEGACNMSRSFSGWVAHHFLSKIDDELSRVVAGVVTLASDAAQLLNAPLDCPVRAERMERLRAHLSCLMIQRSHVHMHLAELRHEQHGRVAAMVVKRLARESDGQLAAISISLANALQASRAASAALAQDDDYGSAQKRVGVAVDRASSMPVVGRDTAAADAGNVASPATQVRVRTGSLHSPARTPLRSSQAGLHSPAASPQRVPTADLQPPSRTLHTLTAGVQSQGSTELPDIEQLLSEVMGMQPGSYHPSDTVAWMACLYALARVLDAAIQVGRTAAEAGCSRSGPHPLRAADLAAQSLLAWLK